MGIYAIPVLLARRDLCTPAERELLLQRLEEIQATLDLCHARDPRTGRETGRWNLVTETTGEPPPGNIFTTTLVFQGLIELSLHRAAVARRTSPARGTLSHHLGRGTRTVRRQGLADARPLRGGPQRRADASAVRPAAPGRAIRPRDLTSGHSRPYSRHLADCTTRDFDHPINTTVFDIDALGYAGERLVIQRPVRFLWHPWATECAARWLVRLNRTGAPHEDIVATRRVLAHLVLTLWPQAEPELKSGYAYVLYEGVLGLTPLTELE